MTKLEDELAGALDNIFAGKLEHYDGSYARLIEDLRDDVRTTLSRYSTVKGLGEPGLTALEVEGWQPIETAPKDCSEVLLFSPINGVCVGQYECHAPEPWWCYDVHDLGVTPCEVVKPTHWMPLPQPPLQGSEAAGSPETPLEAIGKGSA